MADELDPVPAGLVDRMIAIVRDLLAPAEKDGAEDLRSSPPSA